MTVYEYGTALREVNGEVWDHEPYGGIPESEDDRAEYLRALNAEHRDDMADAWDGSVIVIVRRQKVTEWELIEERVN